MIIQRLNENLILHKYFHCDACGKEINMGYHSSVYPPKPWTHKEVKQDGFYLLKHYCKGCEKEETIID